MSSRAIVLMIVLVVAGFTIMSLREYFTSEPEVAAPEIVEKRILVAKRNLTSGTFIDIAQDLEFQPEPKIDGASDVIAQGETEEVSAPKNNFQYEGSVNLEDFAGAIVRRSVRAGDPITSTMLMRSGEGGFMSAVLESGKRAVSISVNPVSGNAGFISPGDRVDLLITYRMRNSSNADSGIPDSIATETFVHNVRVLAVDQSLDNPENKAMLASTITVEVTPAEAEKISVASELGKLSVALVSTVTSEGKNSEVVEPASIQAVNPNYTIDGDVSKLIEKNQNSVSRVRVIRADKVENLEFYQEKQ